MEHFSLRITNNVAFTHNYHIHPNYLLWSYLSVLLHSVSKDFSGCLPLDKKQNKKNNTFYLLQHFGFFLAQFLKNPVVAGCTGPVKQAAIIGRPQST